MKLFLCICMHIDSLLMWDGDSDQDRRGDVLETNGETFLIKGNMLISHIYGYTFF